MKIAIDCRFWGEEYTGLGRYTKNLVTNILSQDKKNIYVLIIRSKFFSEFSKLAIDDKNVILKKIDIDHYSLKEQIYLPKIIEELNVDLVHFPHFNLPYFIKRQYIVTIHDLIKHFSKGKETTTRNYWLYELKHMGYKLLLKRIVFKAKKIIVPSKFVKNQLLENYVLPKDKIQVIYEGIDPSFNAFNLEEIGEFHKKYNLYRPFLIYTGSAYPHKNLNRLLLAIKDFNSNNKKINLIIIGSRNVFLKRIQNEIKHLNLSDSVKLVGFLKDNEVKYLYRQAIAFVMPSLMEGFGLPILEAMSVGCPIICSKIEVFREIYKNLPFYFNPIDVYDIKDKIQLAFNLSSQRRKKIAIDQMKFVNNFSWQENAQKTLEVYENCLSL